MPQKKNQYKNPFLKARVPLAGNAPSEISNIQNAIALHQLGKFELAGALYRQILAMDRKNADALHLLGVISHQTGNHQLAVDLIGQAIEIKPNEATYYTNRGVALRELRQFDAAVESYDKGIALKPDDTLAHLNRGNALKDLMELSSAVASYDKAIELNPKFGEAYYNRGRALQELGQFKAAIASYDKAIELNPEFPNVYSNKGTALQELKQLDDAIVSYDKAISLKPSFVEAYFNRGIALQELKQLNAAIASYDKVIELNPEFPDVYSNRGAALQELNQLDDAIASYDKAISLKPTFVEAYFNRGTALQELKQFNSAIASYDKAISLKQDYKYLFGMIQHLKMQNCDWQNFQSTVNELGSKIQSGMKVSTCLPALALPLSLQEQRKVAETWSKDKYPFNPSLGPLVKASKNQKIRIGYYSSDFHSHPVSILTVGLFENHDKTKFELIAFSFGPKILDRMNDRLKKAFDQFFDVRAKTDKEIAALSRTLGISIAIDLGGHTQHNRSGIFSFRAAPIQASYVGYLGTMGAEYYDYLFADRTLLPIASQPFYSEKIIYLPSYQVNDNKQDIPSLALSRQELNLPSAGFVFCCFNSNYKITPSTFDCWMRILKVVPESILLLYTDNPTAAKNLKMEAEKRGVNPERLIFGEKLIRSDYLARCKSADLFLDTLPYNAGATASDALWAGLPVLTCMGESFASRYAASLLLAIGLPELVTETQAQYESLAVELALNPIKLKSIKDKLEKNRLTTPLFDTQLFTKHIEVAYTMIYERYQADLPTDHIHIDLLP